MLMCVMCNNHNEYKHPQIWHLSELRSGWLACVLLAVYCAISQNRREKNIRKRENYQNMSLLSFLLKFNICSQKLH